MELKSQCLKYLRQALDDPSATFRDGQWEAIRDIVSKQRTLLLVRRTGWGKSMVYFIATRLMRDRGRGPTLLVSPLLALMRNQIQAAERLGLTARTINSTNKKKWDEVEQQLRNGEVDLLLISPERLSNTKFRKNVLSKIANRIGLFVVDEAHCISDWGHDFRPDYQRITRILKKLPSNVPVIATTATANDRVVEDVEDQLGEEIVVSRGPLARASLRLQNVHMPSPTDRMAWLTETLPELPRSGIIYTLTIRDARQLTEWLRQKGINARSYSGRRDNDNREALEQALLNDEVKVLVSTVALGMGFDKPDMGFVIHYQRPGSVVHYYQQVGRGGRDGNTAYGVLMHGAEDDEIINYFIEKAFPSKSELNEVLAAVEDAREGIKLRHIEQRVNLPNKRIESILKLLEVQSPAPVYSEGKTWYRTTVDFEMDWEHVQSITQIRREEQAEMQRYMKHEECLMAFLQEALDDPTAEPCGICASCNGSPLLPETVSMDVANEAAKFLKRSEVVIEKRKQWPHTDALSAYEWKSKMQDYLKAEEGRALSKWGDAGWGQLVRKGKYETERFDDRLVEAACEMIDERWNPDPAPKWVTCVPSNNRPELVPGYAGRLAKALNLPFHACVRKVRDNASQKHMENTEQQTSNLNGVFDVDGTVPSGPVLLVDDTVDSKWTLTVVAALLREAGSGPVHPFVLADASSR